MNRIEAKFNQLHRAEKKAFVAFITAGYPNLKTTAALVKELSRIGVDIIELGVPFSDPMADGVVIQEASQAALQKGVTLESILHMVKGIRAHVDTPMCLMTYFNPVFRLGMEEFAKTCKLAGVDGLIIPDLSFEEARAVRQTLATFQIDLISFIAPTTSLERMKQICQEAQGFIYYVSLTGVTGPRQHLPTDLTRKLKQIKQLTPKPVCVGFGVASPRQVKQIYAVADGVIVGSAIVRKIKQNLNRKNLLRNVSAFIQHLSDV